MNINYKQITEQFLKQFDIDPNDTIIKTKKDQFCFFEVIVSLLETGSVKKTAIELNTTYKTIQRATENLPLPKLNGGNQTFSYVILKSFNLRKCNKCNEIKNSDLFEQIGWCKSCKKESRSKYWKKYYEKNRQLILDRTERRSRLVGHLTEAELIILMERDNYQCQHCGMTNDEHLNEFGTRLHVDHIMPVAHGGKTSLYNTQLLCLMCNCKKGSRFIG